MAASKWPRGWRNASAGLPEDNACGRATNGRRSCAQGVSPSKCAETGHIIKASLIVLGWHQNMCWFCAAHVDDTHLCLYKLGFLATYCSHPGVFGANRNKLLLPSSFIQSRRVSLELHHRRCVAHFRFRHDLIGLGKWCFWMHMIPICSWQQSLRMIW